MLDIGWSELFVIAVVALIVIGPKDLPKALRTVGLWTRKARDIAREFQGSIDEMMREAELDEVKKQVKSLGDDLTKEVEKTAALADVSKDLEPPALPDLARELNPSTPPEPKTEASPNEADKMAEPASPAIAKNAGSQP